MEHEHIVPFEKKQNLRYMFLSLQLADQKNAHNVYKTMTEMSLLCNESQKKKEKALEILTKFIPENENAILFSNHAETLKSLEDFLKRNGIKEYAAYTFSNRPAVNLSSVFDEKRFLLASDFLLGHTFDNVNHIIHYDHPHSLGALFGRNKTAKIQDSVHVHIHHIMTEDKIDHKKYLKLKKQMELSSNL